MDKAKNIPYGKQNISKNDVAAVKAVLKSEFLTQGNVVPRFEEAIADYCLVKYGVAVNSATSALHLACLSLGLCEKDWLWTSPISFVASANCGLYCGANIDFIDIDPRTFNICTIELERKLVKAEKDDKLPKIIVAVHLAGQSCDMERIHNLSVQYGFKIIEDASHAIGAKYHGKHIGNCKYSDITIFSFHPVKIITTGEGGIALTNNEELKDVMINLRSHGITKNNSKMINKPDGIWYCEQQFLGFNFRMTEIQAALGLSQLQRIDEFVTKRNKISEYYDKLLHGFPIVSQKRNNGYYSSFHLYVIQMELNQSGITQNQIFIEMRKKGIEVNLHYIPIYRHPFYKKMGFDINDYPSSEKYYRQAMTLPIYPDLKLAQQKRVINSLEEALKL